MIAVAMETMPEEKLPSGSDATGKVTVTMRFSRELAWAIEKLRGDFRPSISRNQACELLLIEALEARGIKLEDAPKESGKG